MEQKEFKTLANSAIDKLEKQGAKSADKDGDCLYKSDVGCCIVGHMMTDDKTRIKADSFGESSIIGLFDDGFEWTKQFNDSQIGVMKQLQDIHDCMEMPLFDSHTKEMREVINGYGE